MPIEVGALERAILEDASERARHLAPARLPAGPAANTERVAPLDRERFIPADILSVEAFGAVGDGRTDDTAAIQAALDTLAAAGRGALSFGPGTFRITATLQLHRLHRVAIFGVRGHSRLLWACDGNLFEWPCGRSRHFGVRDLQVVTNRPRHPGFAAFAIEADLESAHFDHLVLGSALRDAAPQGSGIAMRGRVEHARLTDCRFEGSSGVGLGLGDIRRLEIARCRFVGAADGGGLAGVWPERRVGTLELVDSGWSGWREGLRLASPQGATHVRLRHCRFESCSRGVMIADGSGSSSSTSRSRDRLMPRFAWTRPRLA